MNLTDQRKDDTLPSEPRRWIDPDTGQEFVLVPAEHYEKLRAVVDGITRRANWDDPAFDMYEQLRTQR